MQHTHTFRLLDVVALRSAQGSVAAGALGTVLEVFSKPEAAYLVEFADDNGVEIETLALLPSQIEPVAKP
jgi:hypothetical protein